MALAFYGFVEVTVSGDGASENRSAFGALASVTAASILNKCWTAQELKELDASMKVGFPHPHPLLKDDIVVLIGGEMPHWVKSLGMLLKIRCVDLCFAANRWILRLCMSFGKLAATWMWTAVQS